MSQRWILAGLRNRRFFSLAELNAAIRPLLDDLNTRIMRDYGASRADLFATLDRPNLLPLPAEPYVFARWKRARVAPDYHVEADWCWYSVPFGLIRQKVDLRLTHADHGGNLPSRQARGQPRPQSWVAPEVRGPRNATGTRTC